MDKETLLKKIQSVKLCLMVHPDNEQDSEFEDRIDDLQEIEDSLIVSDKTMDKSAREFWKEKFDEYPQTDADKLAVAMMTEYAGASHQAKQQPATEQPCPNCTHFADWCPACQGSHKVKVEQPGKKKSLTECKDEVAMDYGYRDWNSLYGNDDVSNIVIEKIANLYASQAKAVETQQGWIDVKAHWFPYTDKGFDNLKDFLLLFDNGEIKRYSDNGYPMACITHWTYLPQLPEPPTKNSN